MGNHAITEASRGLAAARVKIESTWNGHWMISVYTGMEFEPLMIAADRPLAEQYAARIISALRDAVLCDRNLPGNYRKRKLRAV